MAKIFYESDCDLSLLDGKTVAIIGYGSQGHAHALNLKESGVKVIVGLYEGSKSWKKAEEQGFEVYTSAEAAKKADIIMILINDELQAKLYKESIEPNLEEGNMLMFAHGFNIHFNQIVPPKNVDVTMIAPKAPGHTVRSEYQAGKGTPCLVAVEQNYTGKAQDIALASPVSAAVIYMSGVLEPFGWSYPTLLCIWLLTTFVGCMLTSFVMSHIQNMDLDSDPVYKERLAKGLVKAPDASSMNKALKPFAKRSVAIFLIGVLAVVFYASAISPAVGLIKHVVVGRDAAIMSLMLLVGCLITVLCKIELGKVADTSVFKSGMVACICVLGVAWLGDTFVSGHSAEIKTFAAATVAQYPALLAVVFFVAAMFLYSQAATAKAITPAIVAALGITAANPGDSYMLVACFAAVSALFVLPTYPTLLGAVQMDDTGTTRIGKWVFNHSFFIPGVLAIFFSVAFGFVVCGFM